MVSGSTIFKNLQHRCQKIDVLGVDIDIYQYRKISLIPTHKPKRTYKSSLVLPWSIIYKCRPKIMEENFVTDTITTSDQCRLIPTIEEQEQLRAQDQRLVPAFKAKKLELEAQRHWDLFYKRNETRFFKDRRWTTREFEELLGETEKDFKDTPKLLEVGCGVGNFVFPLLEEEKKNYFFYACDFSPRAVEFVTNHPLYNEEYIKAFQCDITTQQLHDHIHDESVDIVTMIFVLSAINPDKFKDVVNNLWRVLKPGGIVLFRDYGLYDMAQLRFKPGHKISENFYMRQDGTRSYYFSEPELANLFLDCGFEIIKNNYVHRRTRNLKEGIDVPRIFVQGKFRKIEKS